MAYKITDKCEGCDDCTQICPVMAITGEMKEKHEIDPNRCIECGACGQVCEKEGILDSNGQACKFIPKEKWKKPVIDSKLCDGCGICVEECPTFCLEVRPPEEGAIHSVSVLTDPDVCHGCGVCARHCPVEAIQLK